jgi:hypothetical protein
MAVLVFAAAVMAQSVPGLINYQGRLLDDSGLPVTGMSVPMDFSLWDKEVTIEPVVDETVYMVGTSPLPLAHQNLVVTTEVVTAVGGIPVYENPRDYLIDYVNGSITRVDGGFILSGTTVEIDYQWTSYGTLTWSESQLVEVENGLYDVQLGSSVTITPSALPGNIIYLEVAVNGETLAPRQQLTSVPFAMNADLLDGMDSTDILAGASYVHVSGDTITGSLDVEGHLSTSSDLTVAGDIEVVGEIYYNTAQVRYYAVSMVGEQGNFGYWDMDSANNYRVCLSGNMCFHYFPVNLPDRATVIGLRVWGETTSTSHNFDCYLYEMDLTSTSYSEIATVGSTGTDMTLEQTGLSAAIDNASYSYMIYMPEWGGGGANVYVYGIRIDYIVDGPD